MVPHSHNRKQFRRNTSHPFMRGIMLFDDYNYAQYNDFVLQLDPKSTLG